MHAYQLPQTLVEKVIVLIRSVKGRSYVVTTSSLPNTLSAGEQTAYLVNLMRWCLRHKIPSISEDLSKIPQYLQDTLDLTPDFQEFLRVGNPLAIAYTLLLLEHFYSTYYTTSRSNL